MESTPPQVLAVLVGVTALFAGRSAGIPLSGAEVKSDAQQLPTNSFLPSELTVSVLVNQMMLVKMLNDSSSTCSLHEAAIAEANARQEDAKEELRRSLEMALTTMEEKKVETFQELTGRGTQLAALTESTVNDLTKAKQQIKEELNARIQAAIADAMPRKIFQLYADKIPYSEAMDACRRKGGRLAVPENEEENARLLSLVKSHYTGSKIIYFRIGVDDKEEEGVWVNSNTGLRLSFTNFGPGQPDNYGTAGEDCGDFNSANGRWNDRRCSITDGYLCEFTIA